MKQTSSYRLTLLVCLAEIFGLASIAVFPALLPTFLTEWRFSPWLPDAFLARCFYPASTPNKPHLAMCEGNRVN